MAIAVGDTLWHVPARLDLAAMIEPLAVGLEHARRGNPQSGDVPLVLGCGAIGLGVIAGLKLLGAACSARPKAWDGRVDPRSW